MDWYLKSVAAGNFTAAYNIGKLYSCGWGVQQDFGQAMDWFRKGADRGDAHSMYGIATLHRRGEGLDADADTARAWYLKAWQRGLKVAEPWATTPIARWGKLDGKRVCTKRYPEA